MKIFAKLTAVTLAAASCGFAQATAPAGNGLYAAPLAAAYAALKNVAANIVVSSKLTGAPVVIYDPPTFAALSSYQAAVIQLRLAMTKLCPTPTIGTLSITVTADIGGAASGLAALLTAVTPAYAIQGQAITFDNSALIAAFAHEVGSSVIFPAYLPPAPMQNPIACGQQNQSNSVVDLWYGALAAAANVASQVEVEANPDKKKALQAKLDAFQKLADSFLAIDKGPSMMSKLLTVESMLRKLKDAVPMTVIDLRLDSAGIDSTIKTVLFWKSTKLSSTVMAHYTLLNLTKTGGSIDLQPLKTDRVIVLSKLKDTDKIFTSVVPAEKINP